MARAAKAVDRLPDPVPPMLAVPGEPPAGRGWSVEFAWDGYRAVAHCAGARVRVLGRNGLDLLGRFPELGVLPELLCGRTAVLDGEIVALGPDRRPDFRLLQQRTRSEAGIRALRPAPAAFYAFDLLRLDGRSLLELPYTTRRAVLTGLELPGEHAVQVPPSFPDADPATLLRVAGQHGLAGVVAKLSSSRYEPGRRSAAWVQTTLRRTRDVVVGGWRPDRGAHPDTVGSLLLGAHGETGLVYVGQVGTGFADRLLGDLDRCLARLERRTSPFTEPLPDGLGHGARWVRPVLVGEVEFDRWSAEGRLRRPWWRGLRADRDPGEVRLP
ncbi:bifunctional non-homologous end joining protein LigD [Saccharothrix coeruleofusca]|uniref:non-homologous end-joining DNA ligase n=1 Tax=Saccharothrix coeruleofusca TaxID=33919 RepID=UPI0027DD306C|nr:non-homologous end-joining DNA ligase [Saccharothrix coeruleofusca]MBP2336664.1 bifunctional non-homologous end joining protein LigD [Saccharothrix coeruleofusca]